VCGVTHDESIKTAERLGRLYKSQQRDEDARLMFRQLAEWHRLRASAASTTAWLREQVALPMSVGQIPVGYRLHAKICGSGRKPGLTQCTHSHCIQWPSSHWCCATTVPSSH
jgi:hypothetical protein